VALTLAEGNDPVASLPVGKRKRGVSECGLSQVMENGGTSGWPPSSRKGMSVVGWRSSVKRRVPSVRCGIHSRGKWVRERH
jgi:hypothetical protein